MSNGCTSTIINLIGLSGTRLVANDDERFLIIWLLEKDQSICGMGTVGFDLCEMPWCREKFRKQQDFILRVLDGIEQKLGWETLEYLPNESIAFNAISKLRQLVLTMVEKDVKAQERQEWLNSSKDDEPLKNGFPVCQKHNVLLTLFGCHVCNN